MVKRIPGSKYPTKERGLARIASAFEEFVSNQATSGILLLICTIIALVWANSQYGGFYQHINNISLGFKLGDVSLYKTTKHWINDGLMAIFFLLVGLEIKREILAGELSAWSTALLPIIAAIGGMVIPALIYVAINHGNPQNMAGWAIPMATDIAFAIGLMSIMSKRIPSGLLILLAAIAIVDDLGAVLVIAIFYTGQIKLAFLLIALGLFVLLLILNRLRVRKLSPYLVIGVVLWFFLLKSGVHATIAGILVAVAIPGKSDYSTPSLSHKLMVLMSRFEGLHGEKKIANERRKGILQAIENVVREVETPLQRLEHGLHVPVNFIIIPLFVLFNAGVALRGVSLISLLESPIALGIIAGLVIGKMIGIFGACFGVAKVTHIKLPKQVGFRHLYSLSAMAGIGFTMSIFIAELAFPNNTQLLNTAKLGILSGSVIAACIGFASMYLGTLKNR